VVVVVLVATGVPSQVGSSDLRELGGGDSGMTIPARGKGVREPALTAAVATAAVATAGAATACAVIAGEVRRAS